MRNIVGILMLAGVLYGAATPARAADWWWFGDKKPIELSDVRAVVKSLRGVSRGNASDVYVSMQSDGTLFMSLTLQDDTRLYATGDNLHDVLKMMQTRLEETTGKSQSAAEAVDAILNQGRASQ